MKSGERFLREAQATNIRSDPIVAIPKVGSGQGHAVPAAGFPAIAWWVMMPAQPASRLTVKKIAVKLEPAAACAPLQEIHAEFPCFLTVFR
jgi:hypothetical protein